MWKVVGVVLFLCGLALAFVTACGGGASEPTLTSEPTASQPSTHPLHGQVTLKDHTGDSLGHGLGDAQVGGECLGTGGYRDIREGAQVTVKDEGGTIIATSTLHAGR